MDLCKSSEIPQAERKRIGIIFGGRSGEHEVSLLSAASVIRAMNRKKFELVYIGITKKGKWLLYDGPVQAIEDGSWEETAVPLDLSRLTEVMDFALPVVHGPYCEDGKLQGLLEMADIPYGGCGVLASAVAMDKALAKDVFLRHGLPVCRHLLVSRYQIQTIPEEIRARVEEEIGYPCFVKPANMGSSVGISKAADSDALQRALELAARYDRRIIIEEGVSCREVETAVIGSEFPEVAAVGEILSGGEFYDYTAKYTDGVSAMSIPASLPEDTVREIQQLALMAYKAIDGDGYARVDFFIEKETGKIYLNEINTLPGCTKYSMFPLLWKETGLEYDKLLERIIETGYERYYDKNHREAGL